MGRLDGRVVATTRDGDPDDALVRALADEGATVCVWPTLTIGEPADPGPLEQALRSLEDFDWIVFTSARAVEPVARRVGPPQQRPRVAAVAEKTASALEARGWSVDVVGTVGASALCPSLAQAGLSAGDRVLFPAASMARHTLELELSALGARVERVEAYRSMMTPPDPGSVRADLARGVDVVTFASPSAARSLDEALGHDLPGALLSCRVVAIGPTTAGALAALGCTKVHLAEEPRVSALVEACAAAPGIP